jgi:tetraacyldisaccharide-1-P 4'-kinase
MAEKATLPIPVVVVGNVIAGVRWQDTIEDWCWPSISERGLRQVVSRGYGRARMLVWKFIVHTHLAVRRRTGPH